jgi:hypothetical protein
MIHGYDYGAPGLPVHDALYADQFPYHVASSRGLLISVKSKRPPAVNKKSRGRLVCATAFKRFLDVKFTVF